MRDDSLVTVGLFAVRSKTQGACQQKGKFCKDRKWDGLTVFETHLQWLEVRQLESGRPGLQVLEGVKIFPSGILVQHGCGP